MTDEIAEKVANWRTRAGLWLKAFGGMYVALWKFTVPVTLIIIAGLFVAWLTRHSTSENERQAEDARTGTILNDAAVNVQANGVKEAEAQSESAGKASQNASRERQRINQTDSSQTVNSNASQRFCERFPNDTTCR